MLVQALMRPCMVKVGLILLHDLAQMLLAQDEEEIEAFPPHAAQESLANGVGLGNLIGRGQDLDASPLRHAGEGSPELL